MKSNFKGKRYSSKQRKLHKLKRENVVLGQKRSCYLKRFNCEKFVHTLGYINPTDCEFDLREIKTIFNLSEKIGKNSAKIQRLRTQIQQSKSLNTSEEKKLNEHSNCT